MQSFEFDTNDAGPEVMCVIEKNISNYFDLYQFSSILFVKQFARLISVSRNAKFWSPLPETNEKKEI